MTEIGELPDDEIIKLANNIPKEANEVAFAGFLDDYAAAEQIAGELMLTGEWEIGRSEVVAKVRATIKQKALELNVDLPEFDDPLSPINSKEDLEAYSPAFTDFYNFVIDALEAKGRRII